MSRHKMTKLTKGAQAASIALLAVFFLASCTSDLDRSSGAPEDPIPLLVRAITLEDGAVTRSVSAPAAGSSIGVFRQADSYYTTASNNIKYTLTTDKGWQPATAGTDILLGANDSRALLYAYHPNAGKIAVAADNVSVPLAARAYDADYDLSYLAAGQAVALDVSGLVYNFHPGVTFAMKHAYTQLAVALTRGADYGGVGAVTAVSLAVNGGGKLYSGGTQNIATGAYTAGTADINKITYTVPAGTKVTSANKTATFAHLLPPGKDGTISNLTLTVTVDGVTTNTTVSAAGLDLTAGHRYLVKATLNYNGLAVTIQTTDWDSQTAWKEDVSFVPILAPIDIGLPFVIASGNLVATKPAGSSTYEYAFADEQGYYSGKINGGDYFYWNRLDPTENDELKGIYDPDLDPCRKVGDGQWRMPNYDDCESIISMGYVGGTYTMKDGTKENGVYFGTTVAPPPSRQDYYLFLPGAGASWDGETLSSMHGYGCFYDYDSQYPYWLYFSLDDEGKFVDNSIGVNDGGLKNPLRCVKYKRKDPIDIGLPFLIAPGNLVGIGHWGYVTGYKFAEEQGWFSGDYDNGGDYFCHGVINPFISTIASIDDPFVDACKQMGGTWRTPTAEESCKLTGSSPYDGTISQCAGTYTYVESGSEKTVNGFWIGTSSQPSLDEQQKYVFLPDAGCVHVMERHAYWQNKGDGFNGYAHLILMDGKNCWTGGGGEGDYDVDTKAPIRCVCDK